jgi:microcystin-dependent protein
MFTGAVTAMAGQAGSVPSGWLKCDGSTYNIADYPALYAVIGQSYGGSGSTFKLPDLSSQLGAGPTSPQYLDYYIKT